LSAPGMANWVDLVPESEITIEGVEVVGSSFLVAGSFRAASLVRHHAHDGALRGEVELPELGSLMGLDGSTDETLAMISFTSFTRPSSLFRWTGGALEPWSSLPGAPDPDAFDVEAVRYPSTDGTEVTMFVVRGTRPVDDRPPATILSGYGGFAIVNSPTFSPLVVALCEAGGQYARACIRGGAEEGEEWHRAGMRENKQQVFDDFHAAADWLVDEGRTSRERLAIYGGSNGGLLIGAAVTQRPDLCRAALIAVPLLDMVRFHLFLIARLWIPEYGDPDVAEEFGWLHAYSPYHRVVDGTCYPAVLLLTGEEDSRVDPAHARKMAARLQEATSCGDERPVLVRIESRAGHGQGKPVTKQADEGADVLTFVLSQLS
jgi:prolyl oligopeptidase